MDVDRAAGARRRLTRGGHKSCQLERRPVVAGARGPPLVYRAAPPLLLGAARERTPKDKCLKGSPPPPYADRLSYICPAGSREPRINRRPEIRGGSSESRGEGALAHFSRSRIFLIYCVLSFFFFLSWKDIYVIFPQLNKESFRLEASTGGKYFLCKSLSR